MSKFSFITDAKSEEFCLLIADEMMKLFGISEEEAIGRMNRDWGGLEIIGDDPIYHDDEEYWAKTIYYEEGAFWWLGKGLKPKPYP